MHARQFPLRTAASAILAALKNSDCYHMYR